MSTADWVAVVVPTLLGSGIIWKGSPWIKQQWSKLWNRPRALQVVPLRFHITLNRKPPQIRVELLVINYTAKPIHLNYLNVPWLQFSHTGVYTIEEINSRHRDIAGLDAVVVECQRELSPDHVSELRQLQPPTGSMFYESGKVTVEYERADGKRSPIYKQLSNLEIKAGEVVGLPYTAVKDSSLWRRFTWQDGNQRPMEWLEVGKVYDGQLQVASLDQPRIQVVIRRAGPNSEHAYVALSSLSDAGPVKS